MKVKSWGFFVHACPSQVIIASFCSLEHKKNLRKRSKKLLETMQCFSYVGAKTFLENKPSYQNVWFVVEKRVFFCFLGEEIELESLKSFEKTNVEGLDTGACWLSK